MEKTISLLLFVLLIISCKKTITGVSPQEVPRLVETRFYNSRDVYRNKIDYDSEGRITRVTGSVNGQLPSLTSNITYSGNEVIIDNSLPTNMSLSKKEIIKYKLDINRQPLIRIKSLIEVWDPIVNLPYYHIYTDTTYFSYQSDGLLLKKEGTRYDSVWRNFSAVETFVDTESFKADYVNVNKSVSEINEEIKIIRRSDTYQSPQYLIKNTFSFSYSKSLLNKVDPKNAFLYEDFYIVTSSFSPFNKNYINIPDKITRTVGLNNSIELSILYNNYGFVASIDENISSQLVRREFVYSQ